MRSFRSYARLDLALRPGLVLAVGPNGVGKTNLLEALHVGTQGFSPRTRTDAQLVQFGAAAARVVVCGHHAGTPLELEVKLAPGSGKRARRNGSPLRAAEQLRAHAATLVFTPDRLAVVKGAPVVRRAYFDRALARLAPARAGLSAEYGAALAQRNAALRRVAAGLSARAAVSPWTEQVALLGSALVEARLEMLALLGPLLAERAAELGLPLVELRYEGETPTPATLEDRLERDLERGATSLGPHLHDVAIVSRRRDLRGFGSQGEQRLVVLALLLAEAELLTERQAAPPLLLLDDVLSELDPARRRVLAASVAGVGQALLTATDAAMLPTEPDQLLEVRPGEVREAA